MAVSFTRMRNGLAAREQPRNLDVDPLDRRRVSRASRRRGGARRSRSRRGARTPRACGSGGPAPRVSKAARAGACGTGRPTLGARRAAAIGSDADSNGIVVGSRVDESPGDGRVGVHAAVAEEGPVAAHALLKRRIALGEEHRLGLRGRRRRAARRGPPRRSGRRTRSRRRRRASRAPRGSRPPRRRRSRWRARAGPSARRRTCALPSPCLLGRVPADGRGVEQHVAPPAAPSAAPPRDTTGPSR